MKISAKKIAALAMMSAILSIGKIVLNLVPNVEVVSLFCALFGYVFGLASILPVTVFCLIEIVQWGMHTWVLSYLIHFNFICVIFWLLSKKSLGKHYIVAPISAVLTFGFSLLDAFLITVLMGFDDFLYRFIVYYTNGTTFVLIHIASNFAIFLTAFYPLSKLLYKIKIRMNL